jgi:hypothetical protein
MTTSTGALSFELARRTGDPDTLAIALFCHANPRPWTDERLGQLRELVALGRIHENEEYLSHGLNYLLLVDRGDLDEADAVLAEVSELQERIAAGYAGVIRNAELSREVRSLVIARRTLQAYLAGRLDEQERLLGELVAYLDEPAVERERLFYVVMTQQGLLALDRGGLGSFSPAAVAFAEELPESTQRQVCAAFVSIASGSVDEGRRFYEPVREAGLATVRIDQTTSFILMLLSHITHALDDAEGARLVQQHLLAFTGRKPLLPGWEPGPRRSRAGAVCRHRRPSRRGATALRHRAGAVRALAHAGRGRPGASRPCPPAGRHTGRSAAGARRCRARRRRGSPPRHARGCQRGARPERAPRPGLITALVNPRGVRWRSRCGQEEPRLAERHRLASAG